MAKEELLKNLYYNLRKPAVYAEKSNLFQEVKHHQRITKEELVKTLHYDLKNPIVYAGKSKLLQEAKKHSSNISTEDLEEWLKSQLA